MEAPFTRVGPGQSVRCVYQVMGQDGPISNPRGIRYIPAGPSEASKIPAAGLPPLSALTAYAQLANVGLGLINVGLTTAVLMEARKQTRMLRALQADVREIKAGMDVLLATTQRIDVNVAQGHLRAGLRHALRSATHDGEVDLVVLARLTDESLRLFYPSAGGSIDVGMQRGLVLASDVRELAESVMHLLFAARRTALEAHNLACGGDPAVVVRDDRVAALFLRIAETAAMMTANRRRVTQMADEVRRRLGESWSFFGDPAWYRRLVKTPLARGLEEDMALLRDVPAATALLDELAAEDTFSTAKTEGPAAVVKSLMEYCEAWVVGSDAGLLWRLQQEVDLQRDEEYWADVRPWGDGDGAHAVAPPARIIHRDVTVTLLPAN